ncbi:MAG: hypothetical protein ACI82F_001899 [Planctomycetota bacterium]|jgi:hypothetical protein
MSNTIGPLRLALRAALGSLLLSAHLSAQADVLATISGEVLDLTPSAAGELIYCTRESDVGVINVAGAVTLLADAASGPFFSELRGVVEDPGGLDIAVVDDQGEIWRLVNRSTPAVHAYDDLYLIKSATDLMVDAAGNYMIPFDTPSNGVRGIAWASGDGSRWAHYLRKHTPLQLAWDPVDQRILLTDQAGGGDLRAIDSMSPYLPTSLLDGATNAGYTEGADDGDMAVEVDGDVLYIAGGAVYWWNRMSGTSSMIAAGYGPLRGIAIAASSGNVTSTTGFSAYVGEVGASTTLIREIGSVDAPASPIAASLGVVPNKGNQLMFFGNIQAFELALDLNGDFLIGGHLFQQQPQIRRVDRTTFSNVLIADDTDGIAGRIEGLAVAPDGTIYALTTGGVIHAITENPLSVTEVYDDAQGLIGAGQDLLLGRNGKLFVADRDFFGGGDVIEIDIASGLGRVVVSLAESRGLAADPTTGEIFVSEWINSGFVGQVNRLDVETDQKVALPGFDGMNYTNDSVWGDGDLVVDVFGSIYTISEDDWALVRYDPDAQAFERIGSSYLNHPSGLVIAPSTGSSSTGWSLFISEFDFLYELNGVHAPAPIRVDPGSPGVGVAVGYLNPSIGESRALLLDPSGGGFLVSTSTSKLARIDLNTGVVSILADASDGLAGDLVGLAARAGGTVLAAASDGRIFELTPGLGWSVTQIFSNAGGEVENVSGLAVDATGQALILDSPSTSLASRLLRIDGAGVVSVLARTRRGLNLALDPLTGETWVTQRGNPADGFGEILRVDQLEPTPTHGHWTPGNYQRFVFYDEDGSIGFFDDGDPVIVERSTGRVSRLTRVDGTRTVLAGGYQDPAASVLAPGRAGIAGTQGTSLFVLDGWVLWEQGVEGLPAGPPLAVDPGLELPPDLLVEGELILGSYIPVRAARADQAGKLYAIFPSLSGKTPGIPLALLGQGGDPRVLPSNQDSLWGLASMPSVMPGFISFLTGSGESGPGTGFLVPNDLSILTLESFVDITWAVIDASATNKVAFLGGTAQLYLGL